MFLGLLSLLDAAQQIFVAVQLEKQLFALTQNRLAAQLFQFDLLELSEVAWN